MAELSPGVRWDDRGEEAIGFVGKEERRGEWRGGAGGGEERWKEQGVQCESCDIWWLMGAGRSWQKGW